MPPMPIDRVEKLPSLGAPVKAIGFKTPYRFFVHSEVRSSTIGRNQVTDIGESRFPLASSHGKLPKELASLKPKSKSSR
jgi:hypothetical protein